MGFDIDINFFLLWLGFDKTNRDIANHKSSDSLNETVNSLKTTINTHRNEDSTFLKELQKLNIGKDSVTNKPFLIKNFNTKIQNAGTVNIGNN